MLDTPSTRPPPPPPTILRARQIALENGVHYAYVGNMHDKHVDSTWCHHCGRLLIGRDWYELSEWQLSPNGQCLSCGIPCASVFEAQPGTWGAKRLAVNM
jgi:pyruvate formate lyase activating enzyme